jgi:hypothetical protein
MSRRSALLDTLVPGGAGYPPASRAGVEAWLAARAERFGEVLARIEATLPTGFAALDIEEREALLHAAEAAMPAAFATLVTGVYSAYYTAPAVLAVIEAQTGYAARPPQPEGHDLAPFDPASVQVPASRPPSWRKALGAKAETGHTSPC